jgi:hypothetical protein
VRILSATATPRVLPSTEALRAQARLRAAGSALGGSTRSLDDYAAALGSDTEPEDDDS